MMQCLLQGPHGIMYYVSEADMMLSNGPTYDVSRTRTDDVSRTQTDNFKEESNDEMFLDQGNCSQGFSRQAHRVIDEPVEPVSNTL